MHAKIDEDKLSVGWAGWRRRPDTSRIEQNCYNLSGRAGRAPMPASLWPHSDTTWYGVSVDIDRSCVPLRNLAGNAKVMAATSTVRGSRSVRATSRWSRRRGLRPEFLDKVVGGGAAAVYPRAERCPRTDGRRYAGYPVVDIRSRCRRQKPTASTLPMPPNGRRARTGGRGRDEGNLCSEPIDELLHWYLTQICRARCTRLAVVAECSRRHRDRGTTAR